MEEFSQLGLTQAGEHALVELSRAAPRQGEVLRRWLAGWSARKISADLGIEVATVHAIQAALKHKLDVRHDRGSLEPRQQMADKLRDALNGPPR